MNSDISYDPVSVIDEKEAIGETAKIFKDIRETMNIPLITSIWRGLAEIDDSLKKIWTIARPIYETQNPEKKLKEIIEEIKLPLLPKFTDDELSKCRLTSKDWEEILFILKAYNRSNGMNMVVLHSIIKQNFPSCLEIPKNNKKKSNQLNIVFTGNMGQAQNLLSVMKSIKYLKNSNIIWHFVGGGRYKERIVEYKDKYNLQNIKFYKYQELSEVKKFLLAIKSSLNLAPLDHISSISPLII